MLQRAGLAAVLLAVLVTVIGAAAAFDYDVGSHSSDVYDGERTSAIARLWRGA